MNHDCNGDVFVRWGKRHGRCLADGSFFDYEEWIEFCPNCERPWEGRILDPKEPKKKHDYNPDDDPEVLIQIDLPYFKRLAEQRGRKIAHLNGKLSLWQGMYYKASGMTYLASLHETDKR